jgi:hypothetical protein
MKLKSLKKSIQLITPILVILALLLFTAQVAVAQKAPPEPKRTLFAIGNVNGTPLYPVLVYIISADTLVHADTWNATYRGYGPIGLTVDEINEHLFISYEDDDSVDIFNARDMTPLGQIWLPGTADLAGMVVHETNGRLYVIDRGEPTVFEFDTTTFNPLNYWDANNCEDGAIDLDLLGDVLYATCGDAPVPGSGTYPTKTIHMYDIDTHLEIGTYTQSRNAVGLAVTDYPEHYSLSGGHDSHDYVTAYYPDSSSENSMYEADGVKGITLNPADGYAYISVGYGGVLTASSIKVIDMTTLQTVNNYPLNVNWSPTDVVATKIPFGGTVKKESSTHPTGQVTWGQQITFEITIENRHVNPIHVLPIKDTYDNTQLSFVSANPPPDDPTDDGELDWSNLITQLGSDLVPGSTATISVTFDASPVNCVTTLEGTNIGEMLDATDTGGTSIPDAAGRFDYVIDCTCQTNADCDDGQFCNGEETCNVAQGKCDPPTSVPCSGDDGVYCNGVESCDEVADACVSSGDPCADGDGQFCNGQETCEEDSQSCISPGNPCEDNGEWCDGSEACDEAGDKCTHSGSPCGPDESCDEPTDDCVGIGDVDPGDDDDDNDTDTGGAGAEDLWPEGDVSGGCCGC